MITSLLIANRGEIACRIIRTARRMGIRTVAVYSDADAKALHVRVADEAVHIGPSPARESYLVGDKIIAAAKATNAEAIHPGYGFLSENADFAQAVIDAGLIWVGPRPQSIRDMGLKDAAKARMIAAGVPVTPGYLGADQSPATLKTEAEKIGYPILIKAVAGGGGKGMRRVEAAAEFDDALDSCKREAASSFGDDRVLLEKYILSPRHIEVQIFGDTHGNIVHLFERDCSLQRRHQKVIEEAPAPGMDEATREQLCGAAVRAAKAVDYVGAGTIEFIADASEGLRADRIWFMEMNTRLQVEHPVTEEITGVDLVEWQLRVASGEALPKRQDELSINGWAVEARLYAEDPVKGFLPSVGRLEVFDLGTLNRIETGSEQGDEISPHYDPMIAKLIGRGKTRKEAIRALGDTFYDIMVWPVKTNARFLSNALFDEDFFEGRQIDTGYIERRGKKLIPSNLAIPHVWSDAAAVALTNSKEKYRGLASFRLNGRAERHVTLLLDGEFRNVEPVDEEGYGLPNFRNGETIVVFEQGQAYEFGSSTRGTVGADAASGTLIAPMPGKVTAVDVAPGDTVTKGQRILTLEAMKMEHGLIAPFDGIVAEINVEPGAQVQVDAVLARVEASPSPSPPG
uniref:acetyl/propionyl/methylcrotonyl-CoA carboxylase subunit alpha n=1 Tax=Sphingomonas sp. TaxID=28214 RepID=UPI00286CB416